MRGKARGEEVVDTPVTSTMNGGPTNTPTLLSTDIHESCLGHFLRATLGVGLRRGTRSCRSLWPGRRDTKRDRTEVGRVRFVGHRTSVSKVPGRVGRVQSPKGRRGTVCKYGPEL